MEKKLVFNPEKAGVYMKVSAEYISNIEIKFDMYDKISNELGIAMEALFLSVLQEEKIVTYLCPRPTFLDWLLRRERTLKWKLNVKDYLKNPPSRPENTIRGYIVEKEKD